MEAKEQLRQIVAQLAGLKPEAIDADFSLKSRGLQSSVRRAALAAAIRRYLGVTVNLNQLLLANYLTSYGRLSRLLH
jgi:aryl carrier-like protein